ncbi:MAG: Uma2 family endonuclease [Byssovorax sp.]
MSVASDRVPLRGLTVAQWAALDEDIEGELVDGALVEEERSSALHALISGWLFGALRLWVHPRGGIAFGAELKLAVSAARGRKADVSAYLPGRPFPGRSAGATRRAPSIVVEVVSPRPRDVRRDVVEKKKEYAAFRVPYYWLVDPQARTFEVLELGADGRYTVALSAAEGAHMIPGCEGLMIDLDELWAAGDRLPEREPDEEG